MTIFTIEHWNFLIAQTFFKSRVIIKARCGFKFFVGYESSHFQKIIKFGRHCTHYAAVHYLLTSRCCNVHNAPIQTPQIRMPLYLSRISFSSDEFSLRPNLRLPCALRYLPHGSTFLGWSSYHYYSIANFIRFSCLTFWSEGLMQLV